MPKLYKVYRSQQTNILLDSPEWDSLSSANIDCFPWCKNGYKPETEVKLLSTDDGLYARFFSKESPVLARFTKYQSPVCKDSCMELFLNPNPSTDRRYLNFEFNPLGTLYLAIGTDRYNRTLISDQAGVCVTTSLYEGGWYGLLHIPFDFLKQHYLGIEIKMRANFYKCAEDTSLPHFGCWNEVHTQSPDFHQPEFFGDISLHF